MAKKEKPQQKHNLQFTLKLNMNVIKKLFLFKNLLFAFIFNSSLLLILIIGIQNSSIKKKVNLLFNETVELPLSFVIGTVSFRDLY